MKPNEASFFAELATYKNRRAFAAADVVKLAAQHDLLSNYHITCGAAATVVASFFARHADRPNRYGTLTREHDGWRYVYTFTAAPPALPAAPAASLEQAPVMTQALVYAFQGHEVRTTLIDGEPWFVLNDVCKALGIGNPRAVAARLDEDEKNTVTLNDGNRGNPNMTAISESGLYAVIVRSDKPEAKPFRKWVTSEVLPAIRKTGAYQMPQSEPPQEKAFKMPEPEQLVQSFAEVHFHRIDHERRLGELEGAVQSLHKALPVPTIANNPEMSYEILSRTDQLARMMGGTAYEYRRIRGEFKKHFKIPRYDALPQSQFAEAIAWLDKQMAQGQSTPGPLSLN